ncbi:hypothetical protein N657DRAFT_678698 [Parathielavia appendiculata]|uniref:Phosphoglycerate mutase n=1 Tax=Parathielavia appendiculata TaxID=2587402 RepID=A0AAN6U353_9PEZI|nr:hypothetical protein N657DRAFT_678698 [Parathielavia appendiculata]
MGRPPAYLFVVRHGYRLDAADKQWHLSSPTPYDPPLTYSGWQQAKSLGARIASIIRERVQEEELGADLGADDVPKRKRYEVVLHSSPFLRCIQTSIAISAGLAQDSTPFEPSRSRATATTPAALSDGRPKPTVVTDMPNTKPADPVNIRRSVLRLDAFLGEWLSPDYFEYITPPPKSVMMLASAKADLLRREDYAQYPHFTSHQHSNSQGQLWSPTVRESSASPSNGGQTSPLGPMANFTSSPTHPGISSRSDQLAHQRPAGYVSPVPHYAVSSNNTIPPGYVSHARDACVAIDYQWDSTRSAMDWGDGGTFPEEWPSMHKRFRFGVQSLVDWYSTADKPTQPVTKTVRTEPSDDSAGGEDDVETEAVVILVSHGAGCNALIGAITHQPVLMDVAMASLTMAVRKPNVGQFDSIEISKNIPPIHELYDLKLFANTDHLRSPVATPTGSKSSSMLEAMNTIRGRHSSFSSTMNGFSWKDSAGSRNSSANAALNGLRSGPNKDTTVPRLSFGASTTVPRLSFGASTGGITVGSGVTSFASARPSGLGRTGSAGLWSPIGTNLEDEEEDNSVQVLNFGLDRLSATEQNSLAPPTSQLSREAGPKMSDRNGTSDESASGATAVSSERSPKPEPDQLGAGTGGLWGAPRPPDDADRLRDLSSSKRRWTVTERS